MKLEAREIAEATGGRLAREAAAGPVLTDTRALVPGAWFLALVGERFDGHDFLETAAAAGAAGCVVSQAPGAGWRGGVVVVEDTTRALQDLGRFARDRLRCPVVGLTGSTGKTTTRALVACALAPLGPVHQSPGNLNNHLGVPMTLLAAPEHVAAVVVEMGSSAPGEIELLAGIARPDVRLVVNVGPAHLEAFGGLDGVAREKGALFETARPGDVLCVNLDDVLVAILPRPPGTRTLTWGRHEQADVRLLDASVDPRTLTTAARIVSGSDEVNVVLRTPGLHMALNASAALAVAVGLGVSLVDAAKGLSTYEPVGMRMRTEPLPGGGVAINDAYNANPASMEASLRTLASLPGRRAAVLGDMLELGVTEAAWHERVAALAASLGLELVALVGPRMSRAADAARGPTEVWVAEEGLDLVERLRGWLQPGDHVLFKGSRGARVERIVHALQRQPAARAGSNG
ncbi:MAG: UDP-N-acetylmuramoyl-tripeptide--D-alanyl-D-alanine ligase [Deltaproteobacteria bacterium]|nr:UDP-N-acetylmuramoyl-tripeptide--D-alanyl-D-alanine ligase [Deltaproteobacteria bacterium]MBW2253534.1 UDP-N-acetylmuramoyl-tripeptide--D-alanyl-D-alanine ligase [Deltaproteobacteria bacterium]